MEQHPVPQNVTTFQFRLIGDMTLKQFGYLAGGAILAYIMYKSPLPFFFTWPLAVLSAVSGFGLAFVPIEERPMDVWVLSFIKSIYSPTQYIWSRPKAADPRRGDILTTIFRPAPAAQPPVQTTLSVRVMDVSPPPIVKPTENKEKNAAQTQLTELIAEQEKVRKQSVTPVAPTAATTQTPNIPTIQIIAPGQAVKAGLPRLTTFPNIVTGIIKDKDKNLLPGVLVTVKDKDGVPLRALKTNRLGQFAASTQLPNGTYLVEIEDPRLRYTFDRAQITLNGTIVPALEIFAKTEKEITRAKLEKELFGKPNT